MQQKKLIEAAIFLSQTPVKVSELSQKLNIPIETVEKLIEELQEEYRDRGIQIKKVGGGYRFQTDPSISEGLKPFVEDRPIKLSKNLLEVLAIVAYNQPITKREIFQIRGQNPDGALKSLKEKGLIEVAGRAPVPGRPKLYRTTEEFLIHFGLNSLEDLPPIDLLVGENVGENSGSS